MKFIDEVKTTPVFVRGDGSSQRHLADLRYKSTGVELTPLDARSGFFVQINTPVRLTHGSRFRVGHYLIEVRLAPETPSSEHDLDQSDARYPKTLRARAELVFICRDGTDGLKFPILRRIFIGRGGTGKDSVDIPLLDSNVSRKHAAIAPSSQGRGLKLLNLSQTDGTFVEIKTPRILVEGDRFRLGDSLLQLVRYPHTS